MKVRLNKDDLHFMFTLLAQGYTVRRVQQAFSERIAAGLTKAKSTPDEQQILTLAVQYTPQIEYIRDQMLEIQEIAGLADKRERIRRLTHLAEAYEDVALNGSTKAAGVYLKALERISDEVGDAKDRGGDRWFSITKQLLDIYQQQQSIQLSENSESVRQLNSGTYLDVPTEQSSLPAVNEVESPG